MKPITLSTTWATALLALATALGATAEPLLNGLALEQEFNKDRYIAAVYSDRLADNSATLLSNDSSRRLEVRVIADRLPARRFRNQWMEGIAINNPGDTLSAQAEHMVAFANLFQGALLAGDQLTVEYAANTGATVVALNSVELGSIHEPEFFNTLLRAWIGPVPPSTEFRDGLLAAGRVSARLRDQFERLQPSDGRTAAIADQVAEIEETAEEVAPAVAAAPAATTPRVAAEIPPPTLAALSTAAETPAAQRPQPSAPAEPARAQAVAASRPAAPPEEDDDDEDEGPLTADLLLARQIYHSVLMRHTYKYIRYPKRAQERGQEGSVRLNVTIDAEGNIRDIQTLQESRFATLNRAAQDAVNSAGPYPAAPPHLARDNYQFTMPITFRLAD